jgi:hypothetical protein
MITKSSKQFKVVIIAKNMRSRIIAKSEVNEEKDNGEKNA